MLFTLTAKNANRFVFFHPKEDQKDARLSVAYKFSVEKKEWFKVHEITTPMIVYDRYWTKDINEKKEFDTFKTRLKIRGAAVYNSPDITRFVRDKYETYKFLKKNGVSTPYTELLLSESLDNVLLNLNDGRFYIKPTTGSRGNGICLLTKYATKFTLQVDDKSIESYESIVSYLKLIISARDKFIIQPEIARSKFCESSYDIRVLVNRIEKELVITGIGVRIGKENDYRSNLNQGGDAMSIDRFLDLDSKIDSKSIIHDISKLVIDVSTLIQKDKGDFIELGFDLILNKKMKPSIIEINSKPSRWMFVLVSENESESDNNRRHYKKLRDKSVRLPAESLIFEHKKRLMKIKIKFHDLDLQDENQLIDWIKKDSHKGLVISKEVQPTVEGYMGGSEIVSYVFQALIVGIPVFTGVVDSVLNWKEYRSKEFTAEVTDSRTGTKYNITTKNFDELRELVDSIENEEE
jgi:glutathione synthase/RimK-type ligase-like ATP-grasp enzyme